jgi:hypothetical protein
LPTPYLLDTNAYALLFQNPRTAGGEALEALVADETGFSFYLPELVALEIHSVLGKYRRGGVPVAQERCDRHIVHQSGSYQCPNSFLRQGRKRMKARVFRALQRVLADIEGQRGPMQATVLPMGSDELQIGRKFLLTYADRYSFGSHDAVVAGTLAAARKNSLNLTLVTSDKGLKALCAAESLPVHDPGP